MRSLKVKELGSRVPTKLDRSSQIFILNEVKINYMMNIEWSEENKWKLYVGYCNMCTVLTISPTSIDNFTQSEYQKVKETYLAFKR